MQNSPVLDGEHTSHHHDGHLTTQPASSDTVRHWPRGDLTQQQQVYTNGRRPLADDDATTTTTAAAPDPPPGKRRKLDSDARQQPRPPSPPWRRVEPDGPTSFLVNGRRRSGRTNARPVESSPQVDTRRSSRHTLQISPPASSPATATAPQTGRKMAKPQSPPKPAGKQQASTPAPGPLRRPRAVSNATPNGVPRRKSRRISETMGAAEEPNPGGDALPPRAPRYVASLDGPVRLPYLHPLHAQPGDENSSFARWLERDDPLAGDDYKRLTPAEARDEALLQLRILKAAEPGGVLSEERCSTYAVPADDEPPPQYGLWDHIAAHACYLRKLRMKEHKDHVHAAKRLVRECADVWRAREDAKQAKLQAERPKTLAELEDEQRADVHKRYVQLVKDLHDVLVAAGVEVGKRRQDRWRDQQEMLGKQTMKSLLHQSTTLLKERRLPVDSARSTDDEGDSDSLTGMADGDEDGETESRMASTRPASSMADKEAGPGTDRSAIGSEDMSSDGSDGCPLPDDEDANLTQDQLRQKYANLQLPDLTSSDDDGDGDDIDDDGDGDDIDDEPDSAVSLVKVPPASDSVMRGGTNLTVIDPADVPLEEVDDILMDDEHDSDTDMGSDDDSAAETENGGWADRENHDNNDDHDDNDDGHDDYDNFDDDLGTWGFLSAQEVSGLQKRPIEHVDDATANATSPAGQSTQSPRADTAHPSPGNMTSSDLVGGVRLSGEVETADESFNKINVAEEALDPAAAPKTPVPALFRGKLRPYQHEGLDWLTGLYDTDTNGILADEMGLGKTIQTIALLARLAVEKGVWGPHLVVVPTSVMLNWEMEFKKFCPGFKVLAYYGSVDERKRKRQGWMNDDLWNVVITSYQLILHDAAAFKKRSWHYLVLDEAHNIKNFQTQRWQTLLTFKTSKRLLLTGTPLQNNLQELWSLLFFLMPSGDDGHGGFAALNNFTTALARPANQILDQGRQELDAEAQATVKQLHEVLRPYLLRRLKADVERQMPGKYEHVVYCRLSKRQRQLYDGFISRADTRQILAGGNYMSIMNCLMSLRKVCNHPNLFETRQIVTSFAMRRPVAADFEIKDLLVRRQLLRDEHEKVDLDILNLNLLRNESTSAIQSQRIRAIQAIRPLEGLIERHTRRLPPPASQLDGRTSASVSKYIEQRSSRFVLEHLQNCLAVTRQRAERPPIYGRGLVQRLTIIDSPQQIIASRYPRKAQPHGDWYMNTCSLWQDVVPTLAERSELCGPTVRKFSCVTPAAVANDLSSLALGEDCVSLMRSLRPADDPDPFHESRVRLSIAFPDKRLLQYDCGKLQRLATLLRDLQAGGHRALIFTQMTRVLDILEQFLNIHGHRYLRLDGATKIEQRQILTDRFNHDPRILCFILSSRSGGLGINLTGADTVIFYDLDWNPAMDKQCQDRCHRIGQTRDVHIYRFVCEYTIEANILRKSNQKRLLDDVIIQKGDFTTDYFNRRLTYRDALDEIVPEADDADDEANAAMDKVLGNMAAARDACGGLGPVLEGIEDQEDTDAAKVAQKEIVREVHIDDADFDENASSGPSATPKTSVPPTPALVEQDEGGGGGGDGDLDQQQSHIDEYLLRLWEWELRNVPLGPPPDRRRRKSKKGQEHLVRWRR